MSDEIDRCPNCSKPGYKNSSVPKGDVSECANGNCSVYFYWSDKPEEDQ